MQLTFANPRLALKTLSSKIIIIFFKILFQDRRNFVRAPPAGVDFAFDYDSSYPTAVAIMTDDPALEKIRFELVPKM